MSSHINSSFICAIMLLFIALILSQATPQEKSYSSNVSQAFEEWMREFNRVYTNDKEKARRFAIFTKSFEFVENFKKGPKKTYTVGLNDFADMTMEEINNDYACRVEVDTTDLTPSSSGRVGEISVDYLDYETCGNINWVEMGVVTPVRVQRKGAKSCGACWAFSTTDAVSAINGIKYGKDTVIPLSVQQLIDCDREYVNNGCRGGDERLAYKYIVESGGLTSEENYPYQAMDGECDAEKAYHPVASITGYASVYPKTEDELAMAVCSQPVTAAIDSNNTAFIKYKGGIFRDDCGTALTHSVLVVGIGRDEHGVQYWRIKNSWGTNWGEGGYMKLLKDDGTPGGHCGIALAASYPIIEDY